MNYMTAEDKERLENQLRECQKNRKVLSDRIGRARELGDLRENAEYHTAKQDQGLNETKIHDLEAKLATAIIVGDDDLPEGMVFIGATVKLRDKESGEEDVYRLVGEASEDPGDYIEVTPNSPMGQSLLKARLGETLRVDLPRGLKQFEIVEIS